MVGRGEAAVAHHTPQGAPSPAAAANHCHARRCSMVAALAVAAGHPSTAVAAAAVVCVHRTAAGVPPHAALPHQGVALCHHRLLLQQMGWIASLPPPLAVRPGHTPHRPPPRQWTADPVVLRGGVSVIWSMRSVLWKHRVVCPQYTAHQHHSTAVSTCTAGIRLGPTASRAATSKGMHCCRERSNCSRPCLRRCSSAFLKANASCLCSSQCHAMVIKAAAC